MTLSNIVSLFGGVAMFLFGMSIMSSGLEKISGGRLEGILERLTGKVYKGVLFGAAVTGVIQSSSGTTVMVVGFVNSGIMSLQQAVGVIMGANIGTTVTSQILRLGDIQSSSSVLQLLKPSGLGPILAVIGIILYFMPQRGRKRGIGQILLGFGTLFFGMGTMEIAVTPLQEVQAFQDLFLTLSNPVLGVLLGTVVTAVIQSSSASVGILQALTSTGAIRFSAAAPIIFGQNIGTCVTALISSIGASKNAKRAAMIHLYFNIIGTVVFLIALYAVQTVIGLPFWNHVMNRGNIADFHMFFNLFNTLLLLPFNKLLVKLAEKTIRDVNEDDIETSVLDERFLSSPSVALDKAKDAVVQMSKHARTNYGISIDLLEKYDEKKAKRFIEIEDVIDKTEVRVNNYLVKLTERELSPEENIRLSELLRSVGDFERIGDYVVNIMETAQIMDEKGVIFTPEAIGDLNILMDAVGEIISITIDCYENINYDRALTVEPLEQVIDLMRELLRSKHIERLKDGVCTVESGTMYLELLINLERLSDHCSNVAIYVIQQQTSMSSKAQFDAHEYLRMMHKGKSERYSNDFDSFTKKYLDNLS